MTRRKEFCCLARRASTTSILFLATTTITTHFPIQTFLGGQAFTLCSNLFQPYFRQNTNNYQGDTRHSPHRSLIRLFATSKTTTATTTSNNYINKTMSKSKSNNDDSKNNMGIMMILSPAKTLDLNPLPSSTSNNDNNNIPDPSTYWTIPNCNIEQTQQIVKSMKKRSQAELGKLLSVSANLSKISYNYWKEFEEDFSKRSQEETKPSIYAFSGAAYQGLQALDCTKEEMLYLQNNLRIIDAVYGILKPLDQIQPYRLEMATRNVLLSTTGTNKSSNNSSNNNPKKKLNEFWKNAVTQQLALELSERPTKQQILLNLASDEYAATLDPKALLQYGDDNNNNDNNGTTKNVQFVKVIFRDEGRVVAVHAKRARGLMVKFLAETKAQTLEDVKRFNKEGYRLIIKDCDDSTIVFDRSKKQQASSSTATTSAKRGSATIKATTTTDSEPKKKRGRKSK